MGENPRAEIPLLKSLGVEGRRWEFHAVSSDALNPPCGVHSLVPSVRGPYATKLRGVRGLLYATAAIEAGGFALSYQPFRVFAVAGWDVFYSTGPLDMFAAGFVNDQSRNACVDCRNVRSGT